MVILIYSVSSKPHPLLESKHVIKRQLTFSPREKKLVLPFRTDGKDSMQHFLACVYTEQYRMQTLPEVKPRPMRTIYSGVTKVTGYITVILFPRAGHSKQWHLGST